MNELIKTTNAIINNEEVNAVNARELWKFLESKQEFANWIKSRIKEYGFEEGKDFLINLSKTLNGKPSKDFDLTNLSNQTGRGGNRRSIDYIITIDMAKELSMVENNEKGKLARRYFIEIENQYRKDFESKNQKFEDVLQQLALERDKEMTELKGKIKEFETIIKLNNPQNVFNRQAEQEVERIFITELTFQGIPVIPTQYLAKRLKISIENFKEISDDILFEGHHFWKVKNISDEALKAMANAGYYYPNYCRNHNLYTKHGVRAIIKHLKSFE